MLVQSFLCIRAATLFSSPRWKKVFYGVAGLSIACGFIGSLLYWVISLMSRAGISHKALPLTEANSTLVGFEINVSSIIFLFLLTCFRKS